MDFPQHFEVIVVGGGHAGTEAALAAAHRQQTGDLGNRLAGLFQGHERQSIRHTAGGMLKRYDYLQRCLQGAADDASRFYT